MRPYLEYRGRGVIQADVFFLNGKGKVSSRKVRIPSLTKRYFEPNELTTQSQINYYKPLKDIGLYFGYDTDEVVTPVVSDSLVDPNKFEDTTDLNNVTNSTKVGDTATEPEVDPTPVIESKDESEPEVFTESEDESSEELSVDDSELFAFLDATYDLEGINQLISDYEVSVGTRASKSTRINKLIESCRDEIIKLIN